MSRNVKIDYRAIDELRFESGIVNLGAQVAASVASECGPGFESDENTGASSRNRPAFEVWPGTPEAWRDELRNNRMLGVATSRGMKIGGGG